MHHVVKILIIIMLRLANLFSRQFEWQQVFLDYQNSS